MVIVQEEWRSVKGYEGLYEVSSFGQVRSLGHMKRIRAQYTTECGYKTLQLYRNNRPKAFKVHRLVAAAFIGDPPDGCTDTNHKNGIKTDNRAENLEWCTRTQNMAHAMEIGIFDQRGESGSGCRFSKEAVDRGYELVKGGMNCVEAAVAVGITYEALRQAVYGKTWGKKRLIWKGHGLPREVEE